MKLANNQPLVIQDRVVLPISFLHEANASQRVAAGRLFTINEVGSSVEFRRRRHLAGSIKLGNLTILAPPPIPTRSFLALVYGANGIRMEQAPVGGMELGMPPELFRAALGAALVAATELVSRRHISQEYQSRTERLQLLRGRPQWTKDMARPPDGSMTCHYELKTTNALLNRLLVTGLSVARPMQPPGPIRRRANRQEFAWRGLAEPLPVPTREHFENVRVRLTRQTEHYRPALALAEAVLLGTRTVGDSPGRETDLPLFNMAVLFERFVQRLLSALAERTGLVVRMQHTRSDALVDGMGDVYRRVRPDAVVFANESPIAVLDAKFKARYTSGGVSVPMASRVTLDDAYQLFFYAERLRRLSHSGCPIPAFIIAPMLDDPALLPPAPRRTVVWHEGEGSDTTGLRILPIPLVATLEVLLLGGSFADAAEQCGELSDVMTNLSRNYTSD
ncbi:hypothetical protein KBY84_07185 [Cyanobium sp. N.Huapi 1H5]|nr:hypothetical protein [Cyanobium sp. N.Huapi 1H5]